MKKLFYSTKTESLKQERLQWIEAGSSAPKQVKSERSAKKNGINGMQKGFC